VIILKPAPAPYIPGEKMEGLNEALTRQLPSGYPDWKFEDVSHSAGIDFIHFQGERSIQLPEDMGSGAAWGDYDNDGWLDLYVVNESGPLTITDEDEQLTKAHNVLYRNLGNGSFADVTSQAGVGFRGCGQGAAWGDYNNDGYLDLVVTSYGEIILYRNNRDGTFTNVSELSHIGGRTGFWSGASWSDYNLDGYPDLYICGYVKYNFDPDNQNLQTRQYNSVIPAALNPSTYKPQANLFFVNNGDGTFSEKAQWAGVDNPSGRSLSAAWCDFDEDGWPDLYVANDISDNVLYHNNGDGTFQDISHEAWVADYRGAMGLAVGDWDGDADMDIFVTHWIAQENALYNNLHTEYAEADIQAGSPMNFTDIADQKGVGQIALDYIGWGTALCDFDNDGFLDLIISNGSTFQVEDNPKLLIPMQLQILWNKNPQQGYFDVSSVSGSAFEDKIVGRGLAVGDYDNDGDADVFVVVNGGRALLLQNTAPTENHWLKLLLRGVESNRFALGARIKVYSGGRVYLREVGSGSSYLSQNAVGEVLVGLGSAVRYDSLKVIWPGGRQQSLPGGSADRLVTITESR